MICRSCREVVRFGWRHSRPGWWHREDKDHDAFPIVEPPPAWQPEELPPVEVVSTPVDPKDERVPGGVRTITNLLPKHDWELVRLTYARGPYVGGKGKVLSISDTILLKARGQEVDGTRPIAVASWRDGKFDFAYIGEIKASTIRPRPANATDMKNWIKGTYDQPADALQDQS